MALPIDDMQPFLDELAAEQEEEISEQEDDDFDEIAENSSSENDELDISDSDLEEEDDTGTARRPRVIRGRDNVTVWNLRPPANLIRPPLLGRMNRAAGPTVGVVDPVPLIDSFIETDILELIRDHTNEAIHRDRGSRPEQQAYEVRGTSINELRALIGLLYMNAVLKNSYLRLPALWSSKSGPAIFAATMSLNRIKFLLKTLKFDNVQTRSQRVQLDRFAIFR